MAMKIPVITLLLVTLFLSGCGDRPQFNSDVMAATLAQTVARGADHVTAAELADWLIKDRRDFELIDIREEADFSTAYIEGARHIPLARLFSDAALASLPPARKIVVYSNGSAHAAQAALLLRLTGRHGLALLGGFNYWQAYLYDPEKAGIAEMDPRQRAQYEAVSCNFAGEIIVDTGLTQRLESAPSSVQAEEADPLGLGLGLGSDQVQAMDLQDKLPESEPPEADPLGLGLGLGLGGEAAEDLGEPEQPEPNETQKLLIKAEC